MIGPAPGSAPEPAEPSTPESATQPVPSPRRILLDTSVLAPEPLWLWTLALTDDIPDDARPHLFITDGVIHELRHALRRIDPRLDRTRAGQAAGLRIDTLTREGASTRTAPEAVTTPGAPEAVAAPAAPEAAASSQQPATSSAGRAPTHRTDPPRPHVLDPDDAHLDEAALRLGIDVLVSDDVHAFAPLPDTLRGYALWTADRFLCALADEHGLDLVAAHARYRTRQADVTRALGLDPAPGSASHRLRRSRAHRFAARVARALRRAPSGGPHPG